MIGAKEIRRLFSYQPGDVEIAINAVRIQEIAVTCRKACFMSAASHQGGSSQTGEVLAKVLGIPFPIRMPALERRAIEEGFSPAELWPWLHAMAGRQPVTRAPVGAGTTGADGWTEWHGGLPPFAPGQQVHVRLRIGDEVIGRAMDFEWARHDMALMEDVVAYRKAE